MRCSPCGYRGRGRLRCRSGRGSLAAVARLAAKTRAFRNSIRHERQFKLIRPHARIIAGRILIGRKKFTPTADWNTPLAERIGSIDIQRFSNGSLREQSIHTILFPRATRPSELSTTISTSHDAGSWNQIRFPSRPCRT